MTVTVEVPEGHKFCKMCGGVFPKDTGFHQQKKLNKTSGEVRLYPHHVCKKCSNTRLSSAAVKKARSDAKRSETSLPKLASEIIDAAWVEAQVVFRKEGKLQWRARHRDVPSGAELIGAYDKGARFDCVLADLTA